MIILTLLGMLIVTDEMQIAKPSQKAILGLRPEETGISGTCQFGRDDLQRAEGAAGMRVPLKTEEQRASLAGRKAEC
jgi:hypothetical protein